MRTVVVGAGAAGLWCALHAAKRGPVTVVAPGAASQSATAWAQGGLAAAVASGDDPNQHAADTIDAGAGLCDPEAVRVFAHEAPAVAEELQRLGMLFDDGGGPTLEGGHSARRVLHAGGDASGRRLLAFIAARVAEDDRIDRIDGRATSLLLDDGRVVGLGLDTAEEIVSDRIVLATGGACGIYGRRTGPDQALGEGMWLAWNAGATLADLEFVQFHPTALDLPDRPAHLFTEALRGEGAVLVDAHGDRFMSRFDIRGELAPRDIVSRAVARVREETGSVFLDATEITDVRNRFPVAAARCVEVGMDLSRDRIPVAPAAHYFTGGVLTDVWGHTTVPGLLACGEVACTGVHGANRLASNSLSEALVFGRRAALAEDTGVNGPGSRGRDPVGRPPSGGLDLDRVRAAADRSLGVERSAGELRQAAAALSAGAADEDLPATFMAWLVATAALRRQESRGGHHRSDFPHASPGWHFRQGVDRGGWMSVPVPPASDP